MRHCNHQRLSTIAAGARRASVRSAAASPLGKLLMAVLTLGDRRPPWSDGFVP